MDTVWKRGRSMRTTWANVNTRNIKDDGEKENKVRWREEEGGATKDLTGNANKGRRLEVNRSRELPTPFAPPKADRGQGAGRSRRGRPSVPVDHDGLER